MSKRTFGNQHVKFLLVGILIIVGLNWFLPANYLKPPPPRTETLARQEFADPEPVAEAELNLVTEAEPVLPLARLEPEIITVPQDRIHAEPYGPPAPPPAWKRYAVPADVPADRPKIVIVIDDLGVSREPSKEIIALPGPLTLAFLPYAEHVGEMVAAGKARGHEIMVHFPMEPMDPDLDTGPIALTTGQTPEEFLAMLDKGLGVFGGYVGLNNHMGSRLTQDADAMKRLMAEVRRRGLLFLDSRTIAASVADKTAVAYGVPHTSRDVFLDDDPALDSVRLSLTKTERIAREHGQALAIGHPKANTIEALREWLPTLEEKGFVLVPISVVVREEKTEERPDSLAQSGDISR